MDETGGGRAALTGNGMFAYYVPDPGEAADWYRDHLGFEIRGDHRDDASFRWVTAAPPGADWQIVFGDVTVHGEGDLADRFRAELGFAPHYMLVVDDGRRLCRAGGRPRRRDQRGPNGRSLRPRRVREGPLRGRDNCRLSRKLGLLPRPLLTLSLHPVQAASCGRQRIRR